MGFLSYLMIVAENLILAARTRLYPPYIKTCVVVLHFSIRFLF
jgi:hypothetical protein